jgi:hypothetical protein
MGSVGKVSTGSRYRGISMAIIIIPVYRAAGRKVNAGRLS